MKLYFKTRQASRDFAKQSHVSSFGGNRAVDSKDSPSVNGSRYAVELRGTKIVKSITRHVAAIEVQS